MEFGVDPERYSISTIVYSFVIKPASGSFMLTCALSQQDVYDYR